ncbi:hypothetical protein AGLY_012857 [Aphis glycines]|uniref:Uncharacterized protein n=1 Tax=Aphis glycines TaxID=307491 RepID=A0A6G0T7V9_APHGL|nr:hypothetical protein AGLY_012857 [Aphis glycines]
MDTKVETKIDSIRNNEIIVIENYKFCRSNVLNNNTVHFRCANKKCGSSVLMSLNKFYIIKFNNTSHNHPACTPKTLALNQVKSAFVGQSCGSFERIRGVSSHISTTSWARNNDRIQSYFAGRNRRRRPIFNIIREARVNLLRVETGCEVSKSREKTVAILKNFFKLKFKPNPTQTD